MKSCCFREKLFHWSCRSVNHRLFLLLCSLFASRLGGETDSDSVITKLWNSSSKSHRSPRQNKSSWLCSVCLSDVRRLCLCSNVKVSSIDSRGICCRMMSFHSGLRNEVSLNRKHSNTHTLTQTHIQECEGEHVTSVNWRLIFSKSVSLLLLSRGRKSSCFHQLSENLVFLLWVKWTQLKFLMDRPIRKLHNETLVHKSWCVSGCRVTSFPTEDRAVCSVCLKSANTSIPFSVFTFSLTVYTQTDARVTCDRTAASAKNQWTQNPRPSPSHAKVISPDCCKTSARAVHTSCV